jgi:ParE-like toxin of type II bacterial toxin-antitoxin system
VSLSPIASPVILKKTKQFPDLQRALDNQVKMILENPLLGDPKKGALQRVRVLKFKYKKQLSLLSYEPDFKKKSSISIPAGLKVLLSQVTTGGSQ